MNLLQLIGEKPLAEWISALLSDFCRSNAITQSGGIVAASKTMHFLLPDLFIMIDGTHISPALNRITDYQPHLNDGKTWYEILPNFDGTQLNPKTTTAWKKTNQYLAALIYYKRILYDWCQHYQKTTEDFLQIDAKNQVTVSRIIDKALWF